MTQVDLQNVCEGIIDDVSGALGCALVDLTTGLPLALDVKPASLLDATAMNLMSAAGVSYFRGNHAGGHGPNSEDSDEATNYVQEIQTTTDETFHFMSLVPGEEQELLILITDRRSTNLGLGWMAVREVLDRLQGSGTYQPSDENDPKGPEFRRQEPASQQINPNFAKSRAQGRRAIWGQR